MLEPPLQGRLAGFDRDNVMSIRCRLAVRAAGPGDEDDEDDEDDTLWTRARRPMTDNLRSR
jgi:hypothetical protein